MGLAVPTGELVDLDRISGGVSLVDPGNFTGPKADTEHLQQRVIRILVRQLQGGILIDRVERCVLGKAVVTDTVFVDPVEALSAAHVLGPGNGRALALDHFFPGQGAITGRDKAPEGIPILLPGGGDAVVAPGQPDVGTPGRGAVAGITAIAAAFVGQRTIAPAFITLHLIAHTGVHRRPEPITAGLLPLFATPQIVDAQGAFHAAAQVQPGQFQMTRGVVGDVHLAETVEHLELAIASAEDVPGQLHVTATHLHLIEHDAVAVVIPGIPQSAGTGIGLHQLQAIANGLCTTPV